MAPSKVCVIKYVGDAVERGGDAQKRACEERVGRASVMGRRVFFFFSLLIKPFFDPNNKKKTQAQEGDEGVHGVPSAVHPGDLRRRQ